MKLLKMSALTGILGIGFWSAAVLATDSLTVDPSGDVGIGTETPSSPLHILRTDATQEFMTLESNEAGGPQDRAMMFLSNNGGIRFQFDNNSLGTQWHFQAATGNQDNFEIAKVGTGAIELRLDGSGNLTIQGTLTQNSDVNAKQDIEPIDGRMVLARLDEIPISEWTYKKDENGARHLGPMAQDFHAAFGLGVDETKIAPGDMAGINMAAIKALREEKNKEISKLRAENKNLEAGMVEKDAKIAALEERLSRLESLMQVKR